MKLGEVSICKCGVQMDRIDSHYADNDDMILIVKCPKCSDKRTITTHVTDSTVVMTVQSTSQNTLIPIYNNNTLCPTCNKYAVSIETKEGSKIFWCEWGHVTITNPSTNETGTLIYDFDQWKSLGDSPSMEVQ